MDYILYNDGILPKHFKYCINSILTSDKNSQIHLITNENLNIKEIKVFNTNELTKNWNIPENFGPDQNPLWLTSVERIFYINQYIKEANIKKFIHFDNDVILYQPFTKLEKYLDRATDSINITPLTYRDFVFGYSYVNSQIQFENLIKKLKNLFENFELYKKINMNKSPNEMRILSLIAQENPGLISDLEILPYKNYEFIFDPASYGQYLGGTYQKPKKIFRSDFATADHIVGIELLSKRVKINYNKGLPVATSEIGDSSYLANLHIHSKKLENFLPRNYKNYV